MLPSSAGSEVAETLSVLALKIIWFRIILVLSSDQKEPLLEAIKSSEMANRVVFILL